MSRGITPVIAIILLLLMAVAAAGGFYFVYQGFTESGEESGATQIEQLGETSLAALQIESAAGGRLYVRNVGATDIDLSKSTVYVENQPVSVNRSAETLAERNRAVLKLTEAPGCTTERCEVKISGAASTSKSIDLSKLMCSSNADCYSGEMCEGGVCVEGEVAFCGDGTCDAGEDGQDCYEDCGPRSMLFYMTDPSQGDSDVYVFDWNGSNYIMGENLTSTEYSDSIIHAEYDAQGNGLSIGAAGTESGADNIELIWSYYNGTGWSVPENFTDNEWREDEGMWEFNSSGEAMAVWLTGAIDVAWSSFNGTGMSTPANVTDNSESLYLSNPDFAFGSDDKGVAVWGSEAGFDEWMNYSVWEAGWSDPNNVICSEEGDSLSHDYKSPMVDSNSTHAMAVWVLEHDFLGGEDVIQWSTWDGASWGPVQNISDDLSDVRYLNLEWSGDRWLLVYTNETTEPDWLEWCYFDDAWSCEGNFTSQPLAGRSFVIKNENDAITVIFGQGLFTYWAGTEWAEPVAISA